MLFREKKRNKSNEFPHSRGKADLQRSVFSAGVHTKIIERFSTTEGHSVGEPSQLQIIMAKTAEMCPNME